MALTGTLIKQQPASSGFQYMPKISQHIAIPRSRLERGKALPATSRNNRFYIYAELYDGNPELLLDSAPAIVESYFNWFAYGANVVRDFLTSNKPELDVEIDLEEAVLHYLMYGVVVFAQEPISREVELVDPRYLYLLEDGDYAVVKPVGPQMVEITDTLSRRVHRFNGVFGAPEDSYDALEDANWSNPVGSIGELVDQKTVTPRVFHFVQARPVDGVFGSSVFREMLPAVRDHTQALTDFRSQIKLGSQIIYAKPSENALPSLELPDAAKTYLDSEAAAGRGVTAIKLSQLYGTMLEGYDNISFVSGRLDHNSFKLALDTSEEAIYDVLGLSPSLVRRFQDSGLGVASGVALERTFVRSAATFNEIIQAFKPVLEELTGQEIDWPNPLGQLEQEAQQEAQQEVPIETSSEDDNDG